MIGLMKLAAIGAVLSYGAMSAYELPVRKLENAVSTKTYHDRILPDGAGSRPFGAAEPVTTASLTFVAPGRSGKGDRLDAQASAVRAVTIETREGTNTSILTRVPRAEVAAR